MVHHRKLRRPAQSIPIQWPVTPMKPLNPTRPPTSAGPATPERPNTWSVDLTAPRQAGCFRTSGRVRARSRCQRRTPIKPSAPRLVTGRRVPPRRGQLPAKHEFGPSQGRLKPSRPPTVEEGVAASLEASLGGSIDAYIEAWNERCELFTRTKTVDELLVRSRRKRPKTSFTRH